MCVGAECLCLFLAFARSGLRCDCAIVAAWFPVVAARRKCDGVRRGPKGVRR